MKQSEQYDRGYLYFPQAVTVQELLSATVSYRVCSPDLAVRILSATVQQGSAV
jgi:hypothetical protein